MRLIAENLGGERGGEAVFSGMDFTLGSGEALTVIGPNGSGKSTLLRILCGLLPAAVGKVRLEGGGEDFPTVAAACHYLGHQNAMKPTLSVTENLAFWRSFLGADGSNGRARSLTVAEALETVGLTGIGHLPFGYLSTGQRRRVAIARLLASHRPVWLLDEPTSGLDKASEARFSQLMTAHCLAGGLIVAATHLPLGLKETKLLEMRASAT
ncbi:heme ABC exporter ATP-binding protein CcmA [Mesorhizobium sp. SP-1A]|uniref:heme ABC exporter ATP-binding protein CcmA n=1 Tax=Mesorhizobium sp. SP-1A TaxID=3077840 RepID=UPI0028F706E6|nr:heme ABC exporter ATP-binding protein CcmA [Mesorhizobium sp. SP-1A]